MAASLAPECNEIKEQYDSCFLKWYSEKYLRDSSSADECGQLFKKYRKCMEKTLKERGIDTMLEEARKSNKDNGMEPPKKTSVPSPGFSGAKRIPRTAQKPIRGDKGPWEFDIAHVLWADTPHHGPVYQGPLPPCRE
ncbi:Mitochondrial distribution and morphology protein 35 [Arachnomyces sp. PD_36]|nr:Mitochondrial distribution and morphology protein 35 [Arachnomyces sp. PD_36]